MAVSLASSAIRSISALTRATSSDGPRIKTVSSPVSADLVLFPKDTFTKRSSPMTALSVVPFWPMMLPWYWAGMVMVMDLMSAASLASCRISVRTSATQVSTAQKGSRRRTGEHILRLALVSVDEQDVRAILPVRREDDLHPPLLLKRLDPAALLPDQVTVDQAVHLDRRKVRRGKRAYDADDLQARTLDPSSVLANDLDEGRAGRDRSGAGEVHGDRVVLRELAELGATSDVAHKLGRVERDVRVPCVGGREVERLDWRSVRLVHHLVPSISDTAHASGETYETEGLDELSLGSANGHVVVGVVDRGELDGAAALGQELLGSCTDEESVLSLVDTKGNGLGRALLRLQSAFNRTRGEGRTSSA